MVSLPQLFSTRVMHKRLLPKINEFSYNAYYLMLPLAHLDELHTLIKRRGIIAWRPEDHGPSGCDDLHAWITHVLTQYQIQQHIKHICLVTMPRVLGYGFNPVNFWLCLDETEALRAVLCEVNNTFSERHFYLCAHPDGKPIESNDTLKADKVFHVSPFMQREGFYRFRFIWQDSQLAIFINYYNKQGNLLLLTNVQGRLQPLTRARLWRAFLCYPAISLKTIFLIHWQALKLLSKRVPYVVKPKALAQNMSASDKLKKK